MKRKMILKRFSKIFSFFLIIMLVTISACSETKIQKIERDFQDSYKTTIHDKGKSEIEQIVNETSYLGLNEKRLTLIADLITQNFTDPNWGYQQNENYFCYYPDDNPTYNYCLPQGQDNITILTGSQTYYLVDKKGRIYHFFRVESPSFWEQWVNLNRDPYWIAYQKTGECEALSIFFNHTANQSGFLTRVVRSNGIAHWWNEVDLEGNNEWKYFDVQQFGMRNPNDSTSFFGEQSDFANKTGFPLCNMTKSGVFVIDIYNDKEVTDITDSYDPNFICPHKQK
jgi:hypothetical protein